MINTLYDKCNMTLVCKVQNIYCNNMNKSYSEWLNETFLLYDR